MPSPSSVVAGEIGAPGTPDLHHILDVTGCEECPFGESWLQLRGDIMGTFQATAGCERPFIGLRPFAHGDRDYFFGRDDELDLLEQRVRQNRFVAVVGRRGCGKSSLVGAGLRAGLEKDSHHRWCWVETSPGDAPIRNLASALARLTGDSGDLSEAWADRFERVLFNSSFGIGEALASISARQVSAAGRVLLFVDQFEELFRFVDPRSQVNLDPVMAADRRDEATTFVRLLLTARNSLPVPIHVIVSMRADFVGHCAGFYCLPEAVSRSQFLVPDMTRDQREDVIRKPVQLAGGWIDPGLVQRALNDTNDDPAQLPSLQYAMMRCWERAYRRSKLENARRPHLTMGDYSKVGGVLGVDCAA
jgi:energy-coupling factor transporter ATP-binding protein EcfA2